MNEPVRRRPTVWIVLTGILAVAAGAIGALRDAFEGGGVEATVGRVQELVAQCRP